MARTPQARCFFHRSTTSASRCSGFRPISTGLRCVISPCPSVVAEFDAEPRKAWPSTPSSVAMRNSPSALEPANRLCWPYCVGGMSSQANSVSVTSVIFMALSPVLLPWEISIDCRHVRQSPS